MKICQKFRTTLCDGGEDWTQHKVFNLLITQTQKKKRNKNIFIRIINAIFMTHLAQAQKGHKKNAAKTERRFCTCVLRSLHRALFAYYDLAGDQRRGEGNLFAVGGCCSSCSPHPKLVRWTRKTAFWPLPPAWSESKLTKQSVQLQPINT